MTFEQEKNTIVYKCLKKLREVNIKIKNKEIKKILDEYDDEVLKLVDRYERNPNQSRGELHI